MCKLLSTSIFSTLTFTLFLHKGKTIFKTKANTSKTALLLKLHLKGTSSYSTLNNNNNQFGIFLKTKCQDYNDVYTKHATYEILQFFHIEMMPFGHLFNTRSWFQHIFSPRFRFAQEPGSMCRWPWPVTPPILPPPVKQNMKKNIPPPPLSHQQSFTRLWSHSFVGWPCR